MSPEIVAATHVGGYVLHLRFADGTEGDVDLEAELYGELFEPLKALELFSRFSIHPEFRTLCWPNGADIAPEYLYEKTKVAA